MLKGGAGSSLQECCAASRGPDSRAVKPALPSERTAPYGNELAASGLQGLVQQFSLAPHQGVGAGWNAATVGCIQLLQLLL